MAALMSQDPYTMERLAAKTVYAADLLESSVQVAQQLQKLHVRVSRYMKQAHLIVTWKRGQGVCTMVGSAAKSVGGVLVLAAPLHPKLSLAINAGHKLWKLGAGLKILTVVGGLLREIWQSGCRETLVDFTRCVALLTTKVSVLQECIHDLEQVTGQVNSNNNNYFQAPQELVNVLSEFISPSHVGYATHVMNIVYGNRYYSPLFDFAVLSTDLSNQSSLAQVIREIEGFHFTEFAEQNEAKALVAIGGFLHISRELLDFLDGFQRVTDRDCKFLSECLSKFTEESVSIMKVVSLLTCLNKLSKSGQMTPSTLQSNYIDNNCENLSEVNLDQYQNINIVNSVVGPTEERESESRKSSKNEENISDKHSVVSNPRKRDLLFQFMNRAEVVANSRDFMMKRFSSVVTAVETGSAMISSAVKKQKRKADFNEESESQFVEGNESHNQI